MTRAPSDLVDRARTDVDVFARALVGEPLWRHQLEVLRSPARTRSICSGRQAGKSRTLAMAALHHGFANPGSYVLIISAGEDAAKDLLQHVTMLSSAPILAPSTPEPTASQVTISNGSVIRSVPASQKQVRGKSVDLLILDEASYIDDELWTAAKYTLLARPGSRILMASTPYGRRDRFFAVHFHAGLGRRPADGYKSFHWPSHVSPLVDKGLLEHWRSTTTDREYRTEVLAEWVDEAGAYFTSAELDEATVEYELIPPDRAERREAVGGIDWGFRRDANALVLVSALTDDVFFHRHDKREPSWFVSWIEERFAETYSTFVDRVIGTTGVGPVTVGPEEQVMYGRFGRRRAGYSILSLASETNGVGQAPTQLLAQRLANAGVATPVNEVHTDFRSKENAFGRIKLLAEQGRLFLPRHPSLLRQLAALEYETLDSGLVRIAVPERAGHDDLAMALALAVAGDGRPGSGLGLRPTQIVATRYRDLRLQGSR